MRSLTLSVSFLLHDGLEDPGLGGVELLARHVPGVVGVYLLAESRALGHDLLYDVLAVHGHG